MPAIFNPRLQKKLTGKMTAFCTIIEDISSIGKLWDLLGHFNENNMVDYNKYLFY